MSDAIRYLDRQNDVPGSRMPLLVTRVWAPCNHHIGFRLAILQGNGALNANGPLVLGEELYQASDAVG